MSSNRNYHALIKSLEITRSDYFCPVFFFQNCVGYSRPFEFPFKFRVALFLQKEVCQEFAADCIESVDQYGENAYLNIIESLGL